MLISPGPARHHGLGVAHRRTLGLDSLFSYQPRRLDGKEEAMAMHSRQHRGEAITRSVKLLLGKGATI
jgi:hypothetical protein